MIRSPKFPRLIFESFCKPELHEYLLGDLEEQFQQDIIQYGKRRAALRFFWGTLKFFRPGFIKSFRKSKRLNTSDMLRHDVKTSFRLMVRDKLYSTINLLGLASAFCIVLFIGIYARFEMSYESAIPWSDEIVRITMDYMQGETLIDQDCETYHILGPMIGEQFPEVKRYSHAFQLDEVLYEAEEHFFRSTRTFAVDPTFFQMFNYPLVEGSESGVFSQPREVVLTMSAAHKFFGTTNVLGKGLTLSGFDGTWKVTGVVTDPPANTHLKFDVLLSYASFSNEIAKRGDPWDSNDTYTYLQLSTPQSYSPFEKRLSGLSDRLQAQLEDERIIAQRIGDIHLHSHKSFEVEPNGDATIVYTLLTVAILVILIAIVNYVNLATAKALNRAKEVGLRKVIGASNFQLKLRYLVEAALFNLIAGIMALLSLFMLYPAFQKMTGIGLDQNLLFVDPFFWLALVVLVLISAILSGIFPALVLSAFSPLKVLKGNHSYSRWGLWSRKGLVIVQFSIAIFMVAQTLIIFKQLNFLQQKDLGISTDKVVVLRTPPWQERTKFGILKETLLNQSEISHVSQSFCVPGLSTVHMGSVRGVNLIGALENHNFNFYNYFIDADYLETLRIELLEGENFSPMGNNENKVLLNEEAARLLLMGSGMKDVINQRIDFWGTRWTIIGVVKNFHQASVKSNHIPLIFTFTNASFGKYLSIRTTGDDLPRQVASINAVYDEVFPNMPFDYFFLDQEFDKQYQADQRFQQVFTILSTFALFITCLGLFGLSAFTVAKRTKEIGIRKVLGASIRNILHLMSIDTVKLMVIAVLIAAPLSYWFASEWLNQFAFRINLGFWILLIPPLGVLVLGWITVLSRTWKTAIDNPVNTLRDE